MFQNVCLVISGYMYGFRTAVKTNKYLEGEESAVLIDEAVP